MSNIVSELLANYSSKDILEAASTILHTNAIGSDYISSPSDSINFIKAKIGKEEREHFMVVFLDAQHKVIDAKVMFSGTISQTSVYPREIVKEALKQNAAAVILAHNHPSGAVEPSRADELLTKTLKDVLNAVDVRVLDHIVVGGSQHLSFAEKGLI